MTSMPASRSARAMIFAPRSCPSRPGLATTTRILRVEVAAAMALILARHGRRTARFLPHDQLHALVARPMHGAEDRVGPRLGDLLRERPGRLGARAELRRAPLDRDVVGVLAVEVPLDLRALADGDGRRAARADEPVVADAHVLRC